MNLSNEFGFMRNGGCVVQEVYYGRGSEIIVNIQLSKRNGIKKGNFQVIHEPKCMCACMFVCLYTLFL